jgi:RNA polymerase sigma factor (sigma-70 family)
MTPEKQVEVLFNRHQQWIKFSHVYLSEANMMHAEDVLQTAYMKVLIELRKSPGKHINDTYFYNTIKNIILDDKKRTTDPLKFAHKIKDTLSKSDELHQTEPSKKEIDSIIKDIDNLVETFYHFDKLLFNAYRYEFKSIRKLSKATKIGHVQVFQTVKRCKQKINDKLKFKYYGKE